ncbi:MAG: MBL fold metallo-hydrolase [Clostridiales bacterium]|jgi:glyoxylase-like metal-dependent hydrolase (beta-lactamase superfamily II)|nr:MBL fold metallo-hydrolase [Clostridiales bacterium]
MINKQFTLGALRNNCYIIGDDKTSEIAIIDAPQGIKPVIEYIKTNNYQVKYIILTHVHFDHIKGLDNLRAEFPNAKIIVHKDELEDANADIFVTGGEEIELGNVKVKVIFTPGHTKGGISLLMGDNLFSGDTLFKGTIGRADLPGGSFHRLVKYIKKSLMNLPDTTTVWPGHGDKTTIADERVDNKYLV